MKITILDTYVASYNQAGIIIMESTNRYLKEMFPRDMFFYSYTNDKLGKLSYHLMNKSDYCFIAGTNLLSSNMNRFNQWKVNLIDSLHIKNIVLMGVGWWQYQTRPNLYTRFLLNRLLHHDILHSVRDSYTESKMKSCGFKNIINTACHTMWELDDEHCARIPKERADSVVFTITDYARRYREDSEFIGILLRKYKKVFFWPQGIDDIEYLKILGLYSRVDLADPSVEGLDRLLEDQRISIDYIGTRLHSGIRAMQKKRRTIVLGTDNRAAELSRDCNLVVVPRGDGDSLETKIDSRFETNIRIPYANIEKWKSQFSCDAVNSRTVLFTGGMNPAVPVDGYRAESM